jgi:hypothetical protein
MGISGSDSGFNIYDASSSQTLSAQDQDRPLHVWWMTVSSRLSTSGYLRTVLHVSPPVTTLFLRGNSNLRFSVSADAGESPFLQFSSPNPHRSATFTLPQFIGALSFRDFADADTFSPPAFPYSIYPVLII